MNRRGVFASMGAFGAAALLPSRANAAHVTLGPSQLGLVQRVFVEQPQRVTQNCMLWCWAASISMIFAAAGHRVAQERIVANVYSQPVCMASGNPINAIREMSHRWTDDDGRAFDSEVLAAYDAFNGVNTLTNAMIIDELVNDRPLLYMNQSHAMVVVSCDYIDSAYGPQPQAVGVLDPAPQAQGFHYLSRPELSPVQQGGQMTFIAAVHVS